MILDFTKIKDKWEYTFKSTGAKNTILPMLFLVSWLSIKFKKDIILNNIPKIRDVQLCINYLISLGIKLECKNDSIKILSDSVLKNEIDYELYSSFRYSILTFWLLLNFFDTISIPTKTWWCNLGERKNDLHYDFFESVWFSISKSESWIYVRRKEDNLNNITFSPHIASTTVTENIIIFCALYEDSITEININNFYWIRPDISELLNLLKIFWYNFEFIWKKLTNIHFSYLKLPKIIQYNILSDFDQVLFYIFLWIITKSDINILNYYNKYSYEEINFLNKTFWTIVTNKNNTLYIKWSKFIKNSSDKEIIVDEYPNIMSDSQPLISILWLFLNSIKITDNRFINRYNYSIYYDLFLCKNTVEWNSITIFSNDNNEFVYKDIDKVITLFSIRESGLLLLLSIYFKSKINITNTNILERWYEDIFNNLKLIWTYVEENR